MKKNMSSQEVTKRRIAAIKKAKKKKPKLTQKERYQLQKKRMQEWKAWF